MKFVAKHYTIKTDKFVSANKISVVFLSDLHLAEFGKDNRDLLSKIIDLNPDIVIAGGDMIISDDGYSTEVAEKLMCTLAKKFCVYAAFGNHEKRFQERKTKFGDAYEQYVSRLTSAGVQILDDAYKDVMIHGECIRIYGLSLPLWYYHRFCRRDLSVEEIEKRIGIADRDKYNLLLAHHPRFAETYYDWGADLTLSGHIHGGVMRFGKKVLISPDFMMFPKYGYGHFSQGGKDMLISAGLGEHTVPFRVFNPREILYIEIIQEVSHGDSR